jgi:hypothetical protein
MSAGLALLQVAANLAHQAIALPWDPPDLWELLRPAVSEAIAQADIARFALQLLLEDAVRRRKAYWDGRKVERQDPPPQGWRGRWDDTLAAPVCFPVATIEDVLGQAKINRHRVTRIWAENDWLERDKRGSRQVVHRLDGGTARMYTVPRRVIDIIMGAQREAEANDSQAGMPSGDLPYVSEGGP